MSQYCYFRIYSTIVPPEQISRQVGMQPDSSRVRGSRSADPPHPALNSWRIEAKQRNVRVNDQLTELVERLAPRMDEIAAVVSTLRADPAEAGHGGAVLQVVRYFDDPNGVEEIGGIGPGGLAKMSGQHQLLGWHLNRAVIEFMTRLGVELDVDEYG